MKTSYLFSIVVGSIVGLPGLLHAQEDPTIMFVMHEDQVVVSEMDNYLKQAKKVMDGPDFKDQIVYTFTTDQNRVWYAIPIQEYAQLSQVPFPYIHHPSANSGLAEYEYYEGMLTGRRSFMLHLHPELSYRPELLVLNKHTFRRWLVKYVHPEKFGEFLAHLEEWKALYEKIEPEHGYTVYTSGFGQDNPLGVIMFWGESADDFYAMYERTRELQGDEGQSLGKKMQSLLIHSEKVEGRYHPELSHPCLSEIETARDNN